MSKEIYGAIGGLAGGLINVLGSGAQHRRQKEYLDIQQKNNLALMQKEQENKLEMWNNTNYGAQIKHMQSAGLNPGLMYGMSGGGGTASGGGGGGAGLAGATNPDLSGGMSNGMGMMAQSALLGAQIENIKADTKQKEANAEKTAGVDTEKARSEVIGIEWDNKLKDLDYYITNTSKENLIGTIKATAEKLTGEANEASVKGAIAEATQFEIQQKIRQEAIGAMLHNQAVRQGIALDKAKIKEITEKLEQGWESLENERRGQDISRENMGELTETMLWQSGINATGNLVNSIIDVKKMGKGMKEAKSTYTKDPMGNVTESHTTTVRK